MDLLREVAARVHGERWWVVNVDVVVAAEQPRLAPHLAEMQANLADALEAVRRPMGPGVHVSVTPKRGEGLGFVGPHRGHRGVGRRAARARLTARQTLQRRRRSAASLV